MTERFSPSQVLKDLRKGPKQSEGLTPHKVSVASIRYPKQYKTVLAQLFYSMMDGQFKNAGRNIIRSYVNFSNIWREKLDDDASNFFLGSVDAYHQAVKDQFHNLDWEDPRDALKIAKRLRNVMPNPQSVSGLAWLILLGQIESTYSRCEAAATFQLVRQHKNVALIRDFFWDTGALTYYSEKEVNHRKRRLPTLSQMQTWGRDNDSKSKQAILVSVDPKFFRIYAPMILFNAQQLPEIDFVLMICGSADEAQNLYEDAYFYMSGLAKLNQQDIPTNLRLHALETPHWVGNQRTFYACARFLVIPELLQHYENIYAIDADLFLVRHPRQFLSSTSSTAIAVPKTRGLLGVPPWRRFMAGNLVVNKKARDSQTLRRMLEYLSVGLAESTSWMLDQNALTYASEFGNIAFPSGSVRRPAMVGNFMATWERNFRATLEK